MVGLRTMKPWGILLAFGLLATGLRASQRVYSFDTDRAGAPPSFFVLAAMRQADPGSWLVQRHDAGGVLVHRSDKDRRGYALAIADADAAGDVTVTVRVRLSGGVHVGGLVWRYIDENHYYSLLLDLDRQGVSMYRVDDGNRVRIEDDDGLELDPGAWHTLKVVHTGGRIRAAIGGIRIFEDEDRRNARANAGRIGVIAAGNAEVWFDDLGVGEAPARR